MAIKEKTIEERFIKLSPREHVLKRPDTYVGSCITQEIDTWVVNSKNTIEKRTISYIPAFLKIFDEIITNSSDHAHRPGTKVTTIKIDIDKDFNISVYNDGSSIPVEIHKDENVYVPEMIFGHLMTGTNYDDSEVREGAGRNGLGSKLTNIFSNKFIIDLCDGKFHYYQEFENNLSIINKPEIVKSKNKSYTKISYSPDLSIFKMNKEVKADTLALFKKRVYDLAVYNPTVNVIFNDEQIKINSIKDWAKLHLDEDSEFFEEKINNKWSIVLAQSKTDNFEQCSIVNGNTTWLGGTHVDYVMNQLVKELTVKLTKGNKGIKIKPTDIKNKFHIFLVSTIGNPIFNSQTKETLSMKIDEKFELSDKLYKSLLKSDIIKSILEWVAMKEQAELNKLNKKAAGKTIRIEKLIDAHKAGTSEGIKCHCCIAEGDSAKGAVVAGMSVTGRDYWGVFPIRGRLLNIRNVPTSKIIDNAEIANLMKIIGLVPNKKYTSLDELRYGKLVFFTDSDTFGTSIKGLLINFIHTMWPELLSLGFCYEFITPIIKAKKGNIVKEYYDLENYKKDVNEHKLEGFKIKYYKGLGTSTAEEMKEMFKNIDKHLIKFNYDSNRDDDKIDMIFNNKRADERKNWMLQNNNDLVPAKFGKPNEICDFIDNEFVQFSNYDNIISIPKFEDGFKLSQRKIFFGSLKKNIKDEIKVAQLGAYIAENTEYLHGEANLYGTIINMAQNFIGSNNIEYLKPIGNFGSRRDPNSAASARYIFTNLNPIMELIFKKEDEIILDYIEEEGMKIEPTFYLPIIPMQLINGAKGIGTGWSTDIPQYSPIDIIDVIIKRLEKPTQKYKLTPSYKNWKGTIERIDDSSFISKGVYTKTKKGYLITELPINSATDAYITFLDKLCDDKKIKNYIDNSTDTTIHIEIICDTLKDPESILKLTSKITLSNMNTFVNNVMTKWDTAEDMLNAWIDWRKVYYEKRKVEYTKVLENKFNYYLNLLNFVGSIIEGDLVINNRKKDDIIKDLIKLDFDRFDNSYNYLLNIPVYNLSKEKFEDYKRIAKEYKNELKEYKKMNPNDIWINELTELKNKLKKDF